MRLLAIIFGSLAALALGAALTLPWWLGAALAAGGRPWGLSFERYERLGYTRFRLEQVVYERAPVRVTVEWAEADTPLLWLWRRGVGQPGPVRAGAWSTAVTPTPGAAPATTPRGWLPLRTRLEKIAARLDEWTPTAEVGPGEVTWPKGTLRLAATSWRQRVLSSPQLEYHGIQSAVELAVPAGAPWRASLVAVEAPAKASLRSEAGRIDGEVIWLEQRAPFSLEFPATGWRPDVATVTARDWSIPASAVRLGQHYRTVSGGGTVQWKDGQFTVDLGVTGARAEQSAAPDLTVRVRGRGDTQTFVAEQLEVSLPGVEARLSEPVGIDRAGRLTTRESGFSLRADLARLPWFEAKGSIHGSGRILSGERGLATIEFEAGGERLAIAGSDLQAVNATGRFSWPELDITRATIVAANGEELRLSGGWDFRTRTARAVKVSGQLKRQTLARWLPAQPEFAEIDVDASGEGPWPALTHRGRVRVTALKTKGTRPVDAALEWKGVGDAIEAFAGEARARDTLLRWSGSVNRDSLRIDALQLGRGDEAWLTLAAPTSLRWRPSLHLEPVRLAGPGANVEAEGFAGTDSRLRLSVRGFRSDWLRDLVELPKPVWTIENLETAARWTDGPAEFALEAVVTLRLGEGRSAHVSARLQGDAEGTEVNWLRAGEAEAEIVSLSGRLPLVINPKGRPMARIDENAPFTLNALTTPNPQLWQQLAQITGVDVRAPEARMQLSGTMARPRGEARFRAQEVTALPGRFQGRWPRIENLDFRLTGEENGLRLDTFSVAIEGQAIHARGWLPFEAMHWHELARAPQQILERGELEVEMPDADVAALAQFFPAYLAPQGRAVLDLRLSRRDGIHGRVQLANATLRPLGPLGVVQEINADVRFEGRRARVESVTGRVGGQVVTLRGQAELPEGAPPRFDFSIKGENLPFVRRAGLLVRGDLDLTLTTPDRGAPQIGGQVRLRESLFLTDVRAFIPSGAKGAESRPPYFAVNTPPLNTWGLDVQIAGERFLRLRTPVFNGTATARFQLAGTLGEPRLTGEASIEEGTVRLPFASFEVRQGQVRLTREEPQPQVWVTGATRRYGYDLRMEISGPATAPNLTFTSSPPLEAEQVLLLVMAGQPPKDEIATTDRQRAARFGAFFGQSLLGSLSGDPGGVERLTISSGENVSEQGRETYNIEYRFNDRWALTGEYDEFDDYYAGVKWRFYQKGGERPDEK